MPDNKYVGFLQLLERSTTNAYIGAILVTDLKSVPIEFRVALPVRPTTIQKSLYGETMVPYIGTELCGGQLLKAITHELALVLVAPQYMLEIRSKSPAPVLYAEKSGQPIDVKPVTNNETGNGQQRWELLGSSFQPVAFVTASGFDEDFNLARPLLEDLSKKFDLLEPFERINRAIEVLAEQDQRFAK